MIAFQGHEEARLVLRCEMGLYLISHRIGVRESGPSSQLGEEIFSGGIQEEGDRLGRRTQRGNQEEGI